MAQRFSYDRKLNATSQNYLMKGMVQFAVLIESEITELQIMAI
jgi:hypothetical protein